MRVAAQIAVAVLVAAAIAVLAGVLNAHDPLSDWLAWRYLGVIGLTLLWGLSCLSVGFAITQRLCKSLPPRERLMQSFALGVLAFATAIVLIGLPHGLGAVCFVALPLCFLACGAWPLYRYASRLVRRMPRPGRWSLLATLAVLYGLACAAGLYLNILTPSNLSYDARWYHLPIAEHYAAVSGVVRFDEGWFQGTVPHLTSWLYTWAFLKPWGGMMPKLLLSAHLEYLLFAVTVASLPVLVDQLVKRPRVRAAWVGFFLFPGILGYDSTLVGGSDHVLAFWAIPIFVAFRRFWRCPTVQRGALLGALLAGAVLTKYQAVYLLLFPLLAIGARALWHLARRRALPEKTAVAAVAVALLVGSAPHWALNAAWHGDPLYPYLHDFIGGHPSDAGHKPSLDKGFFFTGTGGEKAWKTLVGVATFGFISYDWDTFHGFRPVYGSLFLPALLLLPFAATRRRLAALAVAGLLGVAAWLWIYHQDRYLQALTPWLAACTLAVLASLWRQQLLVRPLIAALVVLQVLSCGDIYFLPTHAMIFTPPLKRTADLMSTGFRKALGEREDGAAGFAPMQAMLPADAKVLLHETHVSLGLGRAAVHDSPDRQGGIAYSKLGERHAVAALLRSYGVTHVAWLGASQGWHPIGDDVVFFRFVQLLGGKPAVGGYWLAGLPAVDAPGDDGPIVALGCKVETMSALELTASWERLRWTRCPAAPELPAEVPDSWNVVMVDPRLFPELPPQMQEAGFVMLFVRDGLHFYSRKPR